MEPGSASRTRSGERKPEAAHLQGEAGKAGGGGRCRVPPTVATTTGLTRVQETDATKAATWLRVQQLQVLSLKPQQKSLDELDVSGKT